MIFTLTPNPAIDYYLYLDGFSIGNIHRSQREKILFGGKGINVSLILKELGLSSVALGFIAGFTGTALRDGLENSGIGTSFVNVKNGMTRINVKVRTKSETDINANGPQISKEDIDELLKKLNSLNNGDILVLSGNVQSSLSSNFYETLMKHLSGKEIKFIIDAEKDALTSCLKHKPFLIKPNDKELSEIFGVEIKAHGDAAEYARKLKDMGAVNVLVSMGEKGAVLIDEFGKDHFISAHSGDIVNTVGAGDSMVAGFLAGYMEKSDYEYALRLGCACGSATAFSEGLAKKAEILNLLQ